MSSSLRLSPDFCGLAWIADKSPRICQRSRLRSIPRGAGLRRQKLRPPRRRAPSTKAAELSARDRSNSRWIDGSGGASLPTPRAAACDSPPTVQPSTCLIECAFSVPLPPPAAQPATGSSKYRRQPKISPLPTR